MADVRACVAAEMENIERALREMPLASACPSLSALEVAGTAALLHNFYNGIENILKQVLVARACAIPKGDAWHRDLLELARREGVLAPETFELLKSYLAFRHFFAHGYALDLDPDRIEPLIVKVAEVFRAFGQDIEVTLVRSDTEA
jgi:uncharacterized protein YutE (UPF0331/DUF86 family)